MSKISKRLFLFSFFSLFANNIAIAQNTKNKLIGRGRLVVFGLKIFDAELYSNSGKYNPDAPFSLKLTYLRKISGKEIVQKSINEIEAQGFKDKKQLAIWREKMNAIFPNVSIGSYILGHRDENGHVIFYSNGKFIGKIEDSIFSKVFFDIWLGKNTSQPKLRNQLINHNH